MRSSLLPQQRGDFLLLCLQGHCTGLTLAGRRKIFQLTGGENSTAGMWTGNTGVVGCFPVATRAQSVVEGVLDQDLGYLHSAGYGTVEKSLNFSIPQFLLLQLKRLNQEVVRVSYCSTGLCVLQGQGRAVGVVVGLRGRGGRISCT